MSEYGLTNVIDTIKYKNKDFEKKVPVLTFMTGQHVGRRILLADDHITLGRSPEATIMLLDTHVSRIHLAVDHVPEHAGYRIRDLGSSNGTLLNESVVAEAILKDADKITIGATLLRFSWEDELDIKYQTEIEHLLNIDELTGLIVKRRFDEELNRHVAVAAKEGDGLAMLMMDLDGIKQINDTHGHAFGAYTIAEAGGLIKAVIGQKGLASRFGGDEFMAFLPGAGPGVALHLAEEIRQKIEAHPFEKDSVILGPTISIGLSLLKRGDDMDSLLNRADEALYQAKRSGRNRVSVAG